MNQENYQSAMNAPIKRDSLELPVEMAPDSWDVIHGVMSNVLLAIGVVALCAAAGFAAGIAAGKYF